jgi:hypothetical protein
MMFGLTYRQGGSEVSTADLSSTLFPEESSERQYDSPDAGADHHIHGGYG